MPVTPWIGNKKESRRTTCYICASDPLFSPYFICLNTCRKKYPGAVPAIWRKNIRINEYFDGMNAPCSRINRAKIPSKLPQFISEYPPFLIRLLFHIMLPYQRHNWRPSASNCFAGTARGTQLPLKRKHIVRVHDFPSVKSPRNRQRDLHLCALSERYDTRQCV